MAYRKTYSDLELANDNNVVPTETGLEAYCINTRQRFKYSDYFDEKKRPNLPVEPIISNMMLSAFMVASCIHERDASCEPCPIPNAVMVRFYAGEKCIEEFEKLLTAMGVKFTANEGG
jgi:hypothetical protein